MADHLSLKVLLIPTLNPKTCKFEFFGSLGPKRTLVLFAKIPVNKIVFLFSTTGKLTSKFNSFTVVWSFETSKSFAGVLIYVKFTTSK